MAEATKRSPSPTPMTSGHSRRAATRVPGSATCTATNAKWPRAREHGAHGLASVAVVGAHDEVRDDLGVGLGGEDHAGVLSSERSSM